MGTWGPAGVAQWLNLDLCTWRSRSHFRSGHLPRLQPPSSSSSSSEGFAGGGPAAHPRFSQRGRCFYVSQHSRGLQGEVSTARPLLAVGPRRAQAPKRRYPLRPGPKMATGPGGRLGARAAEPLPLPSGPCAGDAGQRRRGRGRAWRRGVAPASRQRRRVLPARSPSSGPWRALPAGILGSPRQSSRLGPRGRAIRLVPKMVALGSRATAGGGRA